jgi:hypothetical protein
MTTYRMVALSPDGALWAIDGSNTALRFLGDGAQQPESSQSLVSVAVVNASTIYGLDASGSLWQLTDTPLTTPAWSSPDLWKAAISPDRSSIWGILRDTVGTITVAEWSSGSWQPRPSGGFYILFLAVGNGNAIWSIDNKSGWWGGPGPAILWNGSGFALVPNTPQNVQWISIAPDDGTVYLQTSGPGMRKTLKYANGAFTTIATDTPAFYSINAGPDGTLYGNTLSTSEIWTLNGGRWMQSMINTFASANFSAAVDGTLCTNGSRLAGYSVWAPIAIPNRGLDSIAISAHELYFEQNAGYVQWSGSQWTRIAAGTMRSISAASDGTMWGVDQANNVYAWNGSGWTQQSGTMQKVAVGSAQQIAGLDTNGSLFFMSNGAWTPIASPTSGAMLDVGLGSDGALAAIDSSNVLWTRVPPGNWTPRVGTTLAQIAVSDQFHMAGVTVDHGSGNTIWFGSGRALHPRLFASGS